MADRQDVIADGPGALVPPGPDMADRQGFIADGHGALVPTLGPIWLIASGKPIFTAITTINLTGIRNNSPVSILNHFFGVCTNPPDFCIIQDFYTL